VIADRPGGHVVVGELVEVVDHVELDQLLVAPHPVDVHRCEADQQQGGQERHPCRSLLGAVDGSGLGGRCHGLRHSA
jgi:hypothetical protein